MHMYYKHTYTDRCRGSWVQRLDFWLIGLEAEVRFQVRARDAYLLHNFYILFMDWILDSLTTYTHHSELQVITVLSLISTLHSSPQYPLSIFQYAVFSRSLATASNRDSWASRLRSFLPRLFSRTIYQLFPGSPSLLSPSCRAQLHMALPMSKSKLL
jgi:hypothetical protein